MSQGEASTSPLSRGRLAAKALVRFVAGFVVVLGALLLSAGTVAYWEAWAYMAVLFVPVMLMLIYLLKNDPALLERRMRMKEKDAGQSLIIKLASVCYALVFLVPGFARRFGWSNVPVAGVIVADVFVLVGYGIFVQVLRENSYASRVIEVEQGQSVITTGPYSIVRHPMYVAMVVMYLATPVALGFWWGVISALPLVAALVARILNEERMLMKELKGYPEYVQTTRYRLIPGVW